MNQAPRRPDAMPEAVVKQETGRILGGIRDEALALISVAEANHRQQADTLTQLADIRHHIRRLAAMADGIELVQRTRRLTELVGVVDGVVVISAVDGLVPGSRATLKSLTTRDHRAWVVVGAREVNNVGIADIAPAY